MSSSSGNVLNNLIALNWFPWNVYEYISFNIKAYPVKMYIFIIQLIKKKLVYGYYAQNFIYQIKTKMLLKLLKYLCKIIQNKWNFKTLFLFSNWI